MCRLTKNTGVYLMKKYSGAVLDGMSYSAVTKEVQRVRKELEK